MIDFHQEDHTQQRVIGGVAAFLYVVLLVVLCLLVKFRFETPPEMGEGMMINFGNVEQAAPGADLAMNDPVADPPRQQTQPQPPVEEEQLTQETDEDVPVVKEKKKEEKKPEKEKPKDTPKPQPQQPAEKPREVNRKALFPGRTEGSKAASDGTGTGAGNQGNPAGTPEGGHDGTGTGTSGNSASLAGRSLVGSLPRPDYNAREQGRVVIDIIVDQQGKVTGATFRSVGSTTQNSTLVGAALRAARQARFNVSEEAPPSQKGTITYNFRMQ